MAQSPAICQLLPAIIVPRVFIESYYDLRLLKAAGITIALPLQAQPDAAGSSAAAAAGSSVVSCHAQLFVSQLQPTGEPTYYLLGLPVSALSQLQTYQV